MSIFVDTNSAESFLHIELQKQGILAKRKRLDLGDVQLVSESKQLCIERKSWGDFAASLSDGRLQEQKRRFKASCLPHEHLVYIIEGSIPRFSGKTRGVFNLALNAWVIKTSMRDNILVLRTANKEDTVEAVLYLHKQLLKGTLFTTSRIDTHTEAISTAMKRKRTNIENNPERLYTYMLASIPGMSFVKAECIVSHYPRFEKLVAVTQNDISEIVVGNKKIGPVLAKRLCAVLRN